MPMLSCEACNGSGYKGVSYVTDKIDNDVSIESIELIKCKAGCTNGLVFKVDDSSYDTKNNIMQ